MYEYSVKTSMTLVESSIDESIDGQPIVWRAAACSSVRSAREFSYAVFRRATQSEIAGVRAPVVFVKSTGVVAAAVVDFTLFYVGAALMLFSSAAWALTRRTARRTA